MSGSLAGLYDPETGLLRNRNDPRYAMAEKLMTAKNPESIPGKGAAVLQSFAGIARGIAAAKLMSDARDDGRADGERQRQEAADFARQWAAPPAAAPDAAPAAPAAPADGQPSSSGSGGPGGGGSPVAPPPELLPIYQKAAADNGVPVELLLAKDWRESGFQPGAVGRAGEIGISQILPSTAADPGYRLPPISAADARDPAKAIPWSAAYLARKAQALGVQDWHDPAQLHRGIAAYNGAGPQADAYAGQVLGHVPFFSKVAGGGAPAPAQGPAPDGGFADGGPGVAPAPAPGLSPASVASAPPPMPDGGFTPTPDPAPVAPHPVMPGSKVMTTRPPADLLFPPAAPAADGGAVVPVSAPSGSAPGMPDASSGRGPALADKLAVPAAPTARGTMLAGRVDLDTVQRLQRAAVAAASSGNPLIRAQAGVLSAQAQQAASSYDRAQAAGERGQDRQDNLEFRNRTFAAQDAERRDRLQLAHDQAAALAEERRLRGLQHQDDMTWRQQTLEAGRLQPGYQWADGSHTTQVVIPGGPADVAQRRADQALEEGRIPPGWRKNKEGSGLEPIPGGPGDPSHPVAPPTGYRLAANGDGYERIPGGPADDRAAQAAARAQARTQGAPPGYQWNEAHTAMEKIPGGPADKPDKLPNDGVVKGITGNMASLRSLDDAIATAQAHPGAFGPGQGSPVVSWAEQSLPEGLGGSPQTSIAARAKVANIGSLKLHERSGAAVTASEFPRLAPFVPSASDNAETVRTKLQGMRQIVLEGLQDQYDTYGPAQGYKPIPGHARALGLDDPSQSPKGGGPAPVAAGDTVPASSPAVPEKSSAAGGGADRRLAAVAEARKRLWPGAPDSEVLLLAQKIIGTLGQ